MTDLDLDPDAEPPGPDTNRRGRTLGRALALVVAVGLAAMWGYVWIYHLSGQGERDMPDRLHDLAWTRQAEQICAATAERIAELPGAHNATSADERADVIQAATDQIEAMLRQIETIAPTDDSRDARITAAWLVDYRIWLDDRYAYADTLRVDPTARFLVTEKAGRYINAPVDRFARVNEMEACMTLGDV
jgi:hypothetical protein